MKPKAVVGLLLVCLWEFVSPAQSAPRFIQLTSALLWQRLEFGITNVPAATNPFDPDVIRLDATFTLPSGKTMTVPAFWYQGYQRGLSGGYEYLIAVGPPQWRLRFTPPESGAYSVSLAIQTNNQPCGSPLVTDFAVPPGVPPADSGYVQVATNQQYFQTSDGQALRLIGMNCGWPGGRGTYDYDDWFPAMQAAGMNFGRILTTPWSFGLETDSDSLNHYRLDRAWQLDYVFQQAEQHNLRLVLCIEFHLMLQPVPDIWGPDNYWQSNPYNATNGGPCINQDAFFTNTVARTIFEKRLRYLIARYGYSTSLMAWEFFSEVDNEYTWLTPADVAVWHGMVGGWMHTNDAFGHLVTTSLTGGSDRPEIWTLPQLDYANFHCYGEAFPAARLNAVAQSFHRNYHKPVLIEEYGTSALSWNHTNDPYLRGFRQGLWGGAVGGSAGTAMSWWYENIHNANDYPIYSALGNVLNRSGWGNGLWTNINFQTSGSPPPTVGDPVPGGQPFNVVLTPGGVWGVRPSGRLAVPSPPAAVYAGASLNSFVQGGWQPALQAPFALNAWFTNAARVVIHLNSVSPSANLTVRVDGSRIYSTNLPNLDGLNEVNHEYNSDIPLNLPAGKHLIEITNTSQGWVYLDWVRLEQVLPSIYSGNWQPSLEAVGLRGPRESLLYVVAPWVSFSGSSTDAVLPIPHGLSVTLSNWPPGKFLADWYDPLTGTNAGSARAITTNGSLTLPLPDFSEDLVGVVHPPATLTALGMEPTGAFQFQLDSETGGNYLIQKSPDLLTWLD
ncbi:MAG TPA: DUF5060 domain-containing protein, partial [Verrucomicrobiae bacterium]|nr:DUF5060 domain-containing protein [Verrucomicrobiae bacterium]